jgi:hypothetical protein
MNGWIGVDLDGTLARDDEGLLDGEIGSPIPAMVKRVRKWHGAGIEVRIVTARAGTMTDREKRTLQAWLLENIGFIPRITNSKDYQMKELWDDRAVQVIPNTGRRSDGKL